MIQPDYTKIFRFTKLYKSKVCKRDFALWGKGGKLPTVASQTLSRVKWQAILQGVDLKLTGIQSLPVGKFWLSNVTARFGGLL